MASQIDFAVAAGLFIVFTATIIIIVLNYLINYFNIANVADLRTSAYDFFNSVFSGPGIPANWENSSYLPVQIGLVTNLYEAPIVVNETNGTTRTDLTINVTYNFDSNCLNKAWNTTVRLYDSNNNLVPLSLYNKTYCASSQYLNKSDLVFNVSLSPSSSKTFFLFYSAQQKILPNYASYSFPNSKNYTAMAYPEMTMKIVSVDKLLALKNLTYDQLAQILSTKFRFYFEVGQ